MTKRLDISIDGKPVAVGSTGLKRQLRSEQPTAKLDIFDHLVGEPSDRFLRERAGYLYTSTMWRMVTPWSKPADVSGEIECKRKESP